MAGESHLEPNTDDDGLVIRLEGHVIDVEYGGWCDGCALPSIVTITVALVFSADLSPFGLPQRWAGCTDCGTEHRVA